MTELLLLLLYYVQVGFGQEPPSTEQVTEISTANPTTVTTPASAPTTEQPRDFTEFNFNKVFNVTGENLSEKELEDLTASTFAAIGNRTEDEEEEGQVYDWWGQYWEDFGQKTRFAVEWMLGIGHVETHDQKLKTCYFIGVTYKNAITDIKKYYPIRYLYVNNLHYEVGFLVEEIIVHYQIAVELYHLMVRKYGLKRYRFYAPTTYMLYMYTNILHQCKTILHLCNMLYELERKYKEHPDTIFQDYHLPKVYSHAEKRDKDLLNRYNQRIIEERKRRLREQRKARKKLFKTGFFNRTTMTRRPKKGPFELHYGWSIENW